MGNSRDDLAEQPGGLRLLQLPLAPDVSVNVPVGPREENIRVVVAEQKFVHIVYVLLGRHVEARSKGLLVLGSRSNLWTKVRQNS